MKRIVTGVLILLIAMPGLSAFSTGGGVHSFEGGKAETVCTLKAPGLLSRVNVILPEGCLVINATMGLRGMHLEGNGAAYPRSPSLSLDGNVLWAFDGNGYGALGRQDAFVNGPVAVFNFSDAGMEGRSIRLPAGAVVKNASLDVALDVNDEPTGIINLTGSPTETFFGASVAGLGDVNGDGISDLAVGAYHNSNSYGSYSREAYVFFGGENITGTPDLTLNGVASANESDWAVAAAGDVNRDGYQDIIAASHYNEGNNGSHYFMEGRVYIYFGGLAIDALPDVVISPVERYTAMGWSVAGAGDVNGDGYADILVGSPDNKTNGPESGAAYLYLGGAQMDGAPDVMFFGESRDSHFGLAVSGAGDLNGDGFDDIAIGAPRNNTTPGEVHVYFGDSSMDNVSDLVFTGDNGTFGKAVAGAGDVNGDGYDDLIAGSPTNDTGGNNNGIAYIFQGGALMDAVADVFMVGTRSGELFGTSVAGAGDLDADGYDDVIIGRRLDYDDGPVNNGGNLYLGGSTMDGIRDYEYRVGQSNGPTPSSVSGAGDFDNDGENDIVIGISTNGTGGSAAGAAYVHRFSEQHHLAVNLSLGGRSLWDCHATADEKYHIDGFEGILNGHLGAGPEYSIDKWGNRYVDIPLDVTSEHPGAVTVKNINIEYEWDAGPEGLAGPMNRYLSTHWGRASAGCVTVAFVIKSSSEGRILFHSLDIEIDEPPSLASPIPDLMMDEDTAVGSLLDLYGFFKDDHDNASEMRFEVNALTPDGIVIVTVSANRYLSGDAVSGGSNDNWTGVLRLRVTATDSSGLSTGSNEFRILVMDVNDPPFISSQPPPSGVVGVKYAYQAKVLDGDADEVQFSLPIAPDGMTMGVFNGTLEWTPSREGMYDVSLAASDRQSTVHQNFSIEVRDPDMAPRFISAPRLDATVGALYTYVARAVDDNDDPVTYLLLTPVVGMVLDAGRGILQWTPGAAQAGNRTVSIQASDGRGRETIQNFSIRVSPAPEPAPVEPFCIITHPSHGAGAFGRLMIRGIAVRGGLPLERVQVRIDGGDWVEAEGVENWTFWLDTAGLENGNHAIEARAFDGSRYSEPASASFAVSNSGRGITTEAPPYWALAVVLSVGFCAAAFLLVLRGGKGDGRRT